MSRSNPSPTTALALLGLGLVSGPACNAAIHGIPMGEEQPDLREVGTPGDDGGGPSCVNLKCRIPSCAPTGDGTTSLTGVVTIPAGTLPLYNATVYIPNAPVGPIVTGASCDRCDNLYSGDPIVMTTTDVNGRFTLTGIPAGADIPLVIRLGKWRRQITIPSVQPCTGNKLDPALTRLPRSRSEGDIPKIALVTGGFDAIECLFRKLGIEDSEFTKESDPGRVNLFTGHGGTASYQAGFNGGANFTVASDSPGLADGWWSSGENLKKYDIIVLPCEGLPFVEEKSRAARDAMEDYINLGGRVFASHWQNVWMSQGRPTMQSIARFEGNLQYSNTVVDINLLTPSGEVFEQGNALADWMVGTGASPSPPGRGRFSIFNGRSTVAANSLNTTLAQRYVTYTPPMQTKFVEQYFSFFAPIGAPAKKQCGRMVFTDMHVSGNDANRPDPKLDLSAPGKPFPSGCVTNYFSAQEKALVFLLFDLANCLQPEIG